MSEIQLSEMKVGQTGQVVRFDEDNEVTQRIEEMGVTSGEDIQIVRFAPLGDPIEVKIRGYLLSLRKDEADAIIVSL